MAGTAATQLPPLMTVAEFLEWPGDGTGAIYELVNGELRARDAASDIHGTITSNLTALIFAHLRQAMPGCRVVANPGIEPRLRADWNYRIPELGVTCTPNRTGVHMMPNPILLVEVLSPSNVGDTWSNIALYSTIPSVREILIVDSREIAVQVLRRGADGSWPSEPEVVGPSSTVMLTSIGLESPVSEVYLGTHLSP